MYAVIQTGGKQYRVANGDVITVEKLEGEAGSTLSIAPVLMLNDGKDTQVGTPIVEGAAVTAEVVEQARGKKIVVFKKKRRQGYQRTHGHRQEQTVLRVVDVTGKARAPAKKANRAAPEADEVPTEAKAKPAAKKAASTTKKSVSKKPAAKKAASTARKSASKKPAAKKAAGTAKKSASKKPAAKKPANKKSGADKE
ncbi:MAG: 50S ribosomal protein L21 [Alphaproteobacteria bacterium]|nr:50S ribosomal protein L21 [Alphaproteobacteria bacterium]